MCVELDTRHDGRYTVVLECDRDSVEAQIVVTVTRTSSVLLFPVPCENVGEVLRDPYRYAP